MSDRNRIALCPETVFGVAPSGVSRSLLEVTRPTDREGVLTGPAVYRGEVTFDFRVEVTPDVGPAWIAGAACGEHSASARGATIQQAMQRAIGRVVAKMRHRDSRHGGDAPV